MQQPPWTQLFRALTEAIALWPLNCPQQFASQEAVPVTKNSLEWRDTMDSKSKVSITACLACKDTRNSTCLHCSKEAGTTLAVLQYCSKYAWNRRTGWWQGTTGDTAYSAPRQVVATSTALRTRWHSLVQDRQFPIHSRCSDPANYKTASFQKLCSHISTARSPNL